MAKKKKKQPKHDEAYQTALERIEEAKRTNATELDLASLGLTSVPPELGQLQALTVLFLHDNQLTSVPAELGQLQALTGLYLSNNQLTSLPAELGQLQSLRLLLLGGNQLPDAVMEAYERGIDELRTYLTSLKKDGDALYEAKLVLVGDGGVGKTSLLDALQGRKFVENRPTTHGIEIATEPFDLPHPAIEGTEIRLNCWDFGGQRIYRVTHQFFFSRRSLYLVLWSPRMSAEQCDVEGWIKRIKLRVGEGAKIIVVATHAETGERVPRINESALRRDHGDVVVDFCEIDSKTGNGIEELKQTIARAAAELPQMGDLFSRRWKEARDEVLQLAPEHPQINFARFQEICQSHELDEPATETLADFMDILGHVVYFGDDQGLKQEMILQPQWLAKAIGYVLEDPDTNGSRGELKHEWLRDIWYDHGKKDFERYDPALHPFFLRLMEKFDVSYRLEGGESSLVAELVPEDRPDLPWYPDGQDIAEGQAGLSLVCQMNDAPPGMVPWLIVRTHRFATDPRRHWQDGMYLAHGDHGSAVVELRDRELHIDVRAGFPSHFTSVLSDHLTHLIRQRWRGLNYHLAVPCPTTLADGERCEGRFELEALREFLADGDVTIRCQKCKKRQDINAMLLGFNTPGLQASTQTVKIDGNMVNSTFVFGHGNETMQQIEHGSSSEVADLLRVVLRAMNAETRDCPRLFTLIPRKLARWKPKNLGRDGLRLTLWCEMPDCEHPTCQIGSDGEGEYTFERPQEWLVKVAPYAKMISTLLGVAAPIAAAATKAAIDPNLRTDVGPKIDVMKEVVTGTLKLGDALAGEFGGKHRAGGPDGLRSTAEGAGLRELYALLLELDPAKSWGNLRRVLTPTGDYLWLCPTHYKEYDPGLPVLPKAD